MKSTDYRDIADHTNDVVDCLRADLELWGWPHMKDRASAACTRAAMVREYCLRVDGRRATTPVFEIGDMVVRSEFTDSFGVRHPESEPLRVHRVQIVRNLHAPHVRVAATVAGKSGYYEGNQRMFRQIGG